jgi:hypothetical protein
MRDLTGLPSVGVSVDGENLVAVFELDRGEHDRRSELGVGAVVSRPLLHGLWLLPALVPVPTTSIPLVKQRRLRSAHEFVREGAGGFERTYSPAGVVRAVAFAGAEASRSVGRAIRFTPIVQRVVLTSREARASQSARDLAASFGIGIVEVDSTGPDLIVRPSPAVIGAPAVYRWWIAELAYASWLQQKAQPVSCGLGFSGPLKPASP